MFTNKTHLKIGRLRQGRFDFEAAVKYAGDFEAASYRYNLDNFLCIYASGSKFYKEIKNDVLDDLKTWRVYASASIILPSRRWRCKTPYRRRLD